MNRQTTGGLVAAACAAAVVGLVLALPGPSPTSEPVGTVATLSPPRPVRDARSAARAGVVGRDSAENSGTDTGGAGALHMLDATELGLLGPKWTWTTLGTTAGEGPTPGASCETTPLATLGAFDIARRDFSGPGDESRATAGQVIGSFRTVGDAHLAFAAMQSWQQTCAANLQRQGYADTRIGPYRTLETKADAAGWWTASSAKESHHNGVTWTAQTAIAASGTTVEVIWIETGEPRATSALTAAIEATLHQSSELVRTSVR